MSNACNHIAIASSPAGGGCIGLHLHETVVRAIVERTQTPVVIHDSVRACYANRAAKRLFRLTDDADLAGAMLSDLWSPDARCEVGGPADRLCIRTSDDRQVSVSAMHVPVFGQSARTFATFLDNPDEVTVPLERLIAIERSQTFLEPVPPVRAAAGCLTQIALNLLTNATGSLTSTDARTAGRIEVRPRIVADRVVAQVKDDGPSRR